jgi:filamentous hemagglutinin family protein
LWLLGFLLLWSVCTLGHAQVPTAITPDGTLGTTVSHNGTIHDITGGTRPGNGPNLFHSFDRFSVGTGDTARFSGPPGIENILSRITGGQQSMIDGLLQSTIPGANLYLLNPSGVLFGPNATLDVSGSFHISTADVVRFTDGATFSAHLGEQSVLTVAPPSAFGFLGTHPAAITIQGSTLEVPEGKTLSVVGGDLTISGGSLQAPSGQAHLVSVAAAGDVQFRQTVPPSGLEVQAFDRLGEIKIVDSARIDTSGDQGGSVRIRSGRLLIDQASVVTDTLGESGGTGIGIDMAVTDEVHLTGGGVMSAVSGGVGKAGDISVTTRGLSLDNASMSAAAFGQGPAGTIRVAVDTLTLTGGASIASGTFAAGQGGTVNVTAQEAITVAGQNSAGTPSGVFANTFGSGTAGRVVLTAPTVTIDSGLVQAIGNAGNAGEIVVAADTLALTRGGQLDTRTQGPGQGGHVTITARDTMIASGQNSAGHSSGVFAYTADRGMAGSIQIEAGRVRLTEAARIDSSTGGSGAAGQVSLVTPLLEMEGSVIDTQSFGTGAAGAIEVAGDQLTLMQGAQMIGGSVRVRAADLTIEGGRLFATTAAAGPSSTIVVEAERLRLQEGAFIVSATAGSETGGMVTVHATESISIVGSESSADVSSGILTFSTGTGAAGRVAIDAPSARVEVEKGVIASVGLQSGAGDVQISAKDVALRNGGLIENLSLGGTPGTINVDVSGTVSIVGQETLTSGLASFSFRDDPTRGNPGAVSLQASELHLDHGSVGAPSLLIPPNFLPFPIPTSVRGGTVQIDVGTLTATNSSIITSSTQTAGAAGNVLVNATQVTLTAGSQISSLSFGTGQGGSVTVTASDTITLSGISRDGRLPSGILASAEGQGEGAGNAGTVMVTAKDVMVTAGAQISSSTLGVGQGGTVTVAAADRLVASGQGSGLFTGTTGRGQGGDITLTTPQLQLTQGAIISAESFADGNAGSIRVAAQDVVIRHGSAITTTASQGDASGGNILIGGVLSQDGAITEGVQTLMLDGSQITANTDAGGGANVTIGAQRVLLERASAITANTGNGAGGNLRVARSLSAEGTTIARADAVVLRGSQMTAKAEQGTGGRIDIVTEVFLADSASSVDASSQAGGINGEVNVQAVVTNLSGLVTPLPQNFGTATLLLQNRCAARLREGKVSSLVVAGRDGIPMEPDGGLPSGLIARDVMHLGATESSAPAGEVESRVQEPQDLLLVHGRPPLYGTWPLALSACPP